MNPLSCVCIVLVHVVYEYFGFIGVFAHGLGVADHVVHLYHVYPLRNTPRRLAKDNISVGVSHVGMATTYPSSLPMIRGPECAME